jgi:hypothetical protein
VVIPNARLRAEGLLGCAVWADTSARQEVKNHTKHGHFVPLNCDSVWASNDLSNNLRSRQPEEEYKPVGFLSQRAIPFPGKTIQVYGTVELGCFEFSFDK